LIFYKARQLYNKQQDIQKSYRMNTSNNANPKNLNNSLTSGSGFKPRQLWKDFCSWIRGHENLYQCLL